jgi:arginyl-tRNA--protein-N-Asp/Glu arginylyltransferase
MTQRSKVCSTHHLFSEYTAKTSEKWETLPKSFMDHTHMLCHQKHFQDITVFMQSFSFPKAKP